MSADAPRRRASLRFPPVLAAVLRSGRPRSWRRPAALALLTLVLAGLGAALAAPAGAARRASGQLANYRIDLTLQPSGDLQIHEELDYTLGFDETHGFRRFIPIKVDYDDSHRRVYSIDGVRVTAQPAGGRVTGGPADGADDLAVAESNDNTVIRIGNAATTVEGTWHYGIDYTVHNAVETADVPNVGTIEELAWNVVGTSWDIPIQGLQVHGTLPAEPINTKCYRGKFKSVDTCDLVLDGTGFDVAVDRLEPFEAVTVYTDFKPGTVRNADAVLEEKWSLARAFRATPLTLGGSALGSLAVVGGIGSLLARQGRDRRLVLNAYLPAQAEPHTEGLAGFFEKADGPVQFRPPDAMTPGLCGVLVDEKADALDVSATIVDLAVRGFLRIEQTVASKNARKNDFALRFLKAPDESLTAYEATLLSKLQAQAAGQDVVLLSELRTKFATQMSDVRKAMYDETMRRNWFRRRPDHVRGVWIAIGLAALALGALVAAVLIGATTYGLLALPAVLPGLMILATANRMPSRTAEGRRLLELCVGYERFLEVADAEELKFTERQYDYVAGLPYAMVFGITHRWAQVLSVLQQQGVNLAPTWYVPINPGGPFSYDDFGRSMGEFGTVAAAALTAPKPSSSGGGFSGGGFSGGFSGGGGGGGGGGGW